jgi:hypothetical protein
MTMSAIPPKADIKLTRLHVRFVPKADIVTCPSQSRTGGAETRRQFSFCPFRAKPRYGQCPMALNNGSEQLPNSGGQSHRQRPPERHSGCGAENICAARSCPDCTEKRKKT